MRTLALLLVAACNSSPPPPSCQQAFTHYYGAGCAYHDATGTVITQDMMTANCQTLVAGGLSAQCTSDLDAWLTCNDSVPSPATTNAQCDCSQEQMTLLACH